MNTGDPLGQRRKATVTTGEDGGYLVPATNENNDQDYDDLEISEEALHCREGYVWRKSFRY